MSSTIGGHDGPHDLYLERIAAECMACKSEVEGRIRSASQNPALAEDVVAQAIKRVIEYADRYRDEKPVENVKGLLITTAHNLLLDAQTRKLRADKLETVSWDGAADDTSLNLPDKSATNEIERRIEADELKNIALRDATPAQRQLFDMWFERGMTPTEISVRLGISAAAVRLRIHTLLALMRAAITKSGLT